MIIFIGVIIAVLGNSHRFAISEHMGTYTVFSNGLMVWPVDREVSCSYSVDAFIKLF